jgi:sarcosine oxidase subunit alpha
VTPQDLGMDWIVSKRKRDFIGLRSFARADTSRPDRKQLVGLLPEERLAEGAHVVPGPGHVTSSYLSAAFGRPFALALLARGRDRIGETVYADGVPAEVVESVLWDKEGARRDGRPA